MPNERVLNLPLSGAELKSIMIQRFERILDRDCYLHEAATYNGFSFDLNCTMKFKDMNMGKETLIWDRHKQGEVPADAETKVVAEKYDSGDSPNKTRLEHELEIPVQVQEGRNTVIRKRKFPKDAA